MRCQVHYFPLLIIMLENILFELFCPLDRMWFCCYCFVFINVFHTLYSDHRFPSLKSSPLKPFGLFESILYSSSWLWTCSVTKAAPELWPLPPKCLELQVSTIEDFWGPDTVVLQPARKRQKLSGRIASDSKLSQSTQLRPWLKIRKQGLAMWPNEFVCLLRSLRTWIQFPELTWYKKRTNYSKSFSDSIWEPLPTTLNND